MKTCRKERRTGGYQIGCRKVLVVVVVAKGQPVLVKLPIPSGDEGVLTVRPAVIMIVEPDQRVAGRRWRCGRRQETQILPYGRCNHAQQ